jgi:hypothetical protein
MGIYFGIAKKKGYFSEENKEVCFLIKDVAGMYLLRTRPTVFTFRGTSGWRSYGASMFMIRFEYE